MTNHIILFRIVQIGTRAHFTSSTIKCFRMTPADSEDSDSDESMMRPDTYGQPASPQGWKCMSR